jgi:hypothetical protein
MSCDRQRFPAYVFDFISYFLQSRQFSAGYDYICSSLGESQSSRPTNAAAGPGH